MSIKKDMIRLTIVLHLAKVIGACKDSFTCNLDQIPIIIYHKATTTNFLKRTLNMNNNLIEITTPLQSKNGTRMFECTRTGAHYGSYASGYVRRKTNGSHNTECFYQLNKKKSFPVFNTELNMTFKNTQRIMINTEEERLALINQRSLKFKNNTQQTNTQQTNTQIQKEEVMFNTNTDLNKSISYRSRSYTNARKNLKWPSYIVQVVHSSMMLNETPDIIASRLDQMLTDIPGHRFNFNSQEAKIEAIYNVMQHLQSRARQSVNRMIDHIDNVDRTRG